MGKKQIEKLDKFQPRFVAHAMKAHGMERDIAQKIWDLCQEFAKYGFNRSHSLAYSMVSYISMYLKHYYPLEWSAAVLSNPKIESDEFKTYYRHWQGIIVKPSVMHSRLKYQIREDGKLVMPFSSVNGLGDKAVESLIAAQPYKSLEDFFTRVNRTVIKKNVMLNLIFSGCLDCFRPVETVSITAAGPSELGEEHVKLDLSNGTQIEVKLSDKVKSEGGESVTFLAAIQKDLKLFSGISENRWRKDLVGKYIDFRHSQAKPNKTERELDEKIKSDAFEMNRTAFLVKELSLLNFTSFDYFDYFKDKLTTMCMDRFKKEAIRPEEAKAKKNKDVVVVAGSVEKIEFWIPPSGKTKGKEMGRITLSNSGESVEVTIFADTLAADDARLDTKDGIKIRDLKEFMPIAIKGEVNNWNGRISVVYDKCLELAS
jgi:DNA polymerase-3 subunit alpha